MEGPRTTRVDSIMLAAMARVDYPAYLLEDLISSGGMNDVYRKMGERRSYKPGGLTVDDIAAVLSEVLDERATAGLRTVEAERAQEEAEQEMGGPKSNGLFPVHGKATDGFPPPRAMTVKDVEPQPMPGRSFEDSEEMLDIPSIRTNVILLRAEMVLRGWRAGKASNAETLEALQKVLDISD